MSNTIVRKCSGKSWFLFLCLLTVMVLRAPGTAFSSDEERSPKFIEYVSYGKYFKCLLPAGWSGYEAPDYSRDVSKVYGVEASQGSSEQRIGISVKYYAGDNLLHKTAERFIQAHSGPLFGGQAADDEKYGPVKEVLITGVTAKTFERVHYEYDDLRDPATGRHYTPITPKRYPMTERYTVIPAKEGFYVLLSRASPEREKDVEGIFQRVLDSFEANVK